MLHKDVSRNHVSLKNKSEHKTQVVRIAWNTSTWGMPVSRVSDSHEGNSRMGARTLRATGTACQYLPLNMASNKCHIRIDCGQGKRK